MMPLANQSLETFKGYGQSSP